MDTTQLIRASAEVVTITSFKAGDVYKRVESGGYNEAKLVFGVVTDAMNNGSDSAIAAIEYEASYGGLTVSQKVWDGTKPAALFAAEPVEVAAHIDELQRKVRDKAETAQKALDAALEQVALVEQVRETVTRGQLTAAATVRGEVTDG
jgi:hypothetical protein